MFQDRRQHPRHPVLIKATARSSDDTFDVICTQVGPAAGFFSCRTPPQLGETLYIELRTSGRGSPIVELEGTVARVVAPGGSQPAGFALVWKIARCELGAEPLLRTLVGVLHMQGLNLSDLRGGRVPEFAIAAFLNRSRPGQNSDTGPIGVPAGADPPTAPIVRSHSAIYRAQGNWSAPVIAPAARPSKSTLEIVDVPPSTIGHAGQPVAAPPVAGRPASSAARVMGREPLSARPPSVGLRPLGVPAAARPGRGGVSDVHEPATSEGFLGDPAPDDARSRAFTPRDQEPSLAVGRRAGAEGSVGVEDPSQSWPVYALAPGERRLVSRTGLHSSSSVDVLAPFRPPISRPSSTAEAPPVPHNPHPPPPDAQIQPHRHYVNSDSVMPIQRKLGSGPISAGASIAVAGVIPASSPGPGKPNDDKRPLRITDTPVTFVRQNQFFAGRLTSVAKQVAIIVTRETPPELDEPITVNMPIEVDGIYRTIFLSGKLLQIPTEVTGGKRFVLHLERVDEGKHKGAFQAFLDTAAKT